MLNEKQMQTIALGLGEMSEAAAPEQVERIEKIAFAVAALPAGHDVDYLVNLLEEEKDETVREAAGLCLREMAGGIA
jgi:hypothetical protein